MQLKRTTISALARLNHQVCKWKLGTQFILIEFQIDSNTKIETFGLTINKKLLTTSATHQQGLVHGQTEI